MCGITAFFAYRSTAAAPRREELEAITARMIPRGPDAGGTWISPDGRVGLGSRRLAIIDLSPEGAQPMWDSAGELAIVFNGEIYNYAELRASLERGGARFHSHTDTEVLLELYRRDGARMLGLVRGMFAFAIWDTRTRRMFVARDPYGIKPLYLADDGGVIRIASEVKALLAGGAVSAAIDPAGAAGFFLNGSVPEPFTIRKDIRAVDAGTSFFLEEERGRVDVRRYYSIAEVFARATEDHLVDPAVFVRERIDESVRHHLVSDVPVGLFLSAGIDSSALAQIAARQTKLHTFTLSFHAFSEAPLAERFAKELGTTHTTRLVSPKEFLDDLPRILERMDQPTIDGVNTWFISKAVHEAGVKVALSGVGGDELFGGYPSFKNVPRIVHFPRLAHLAARARRHPKAGQIPTHAKTYGRAYFLQRSLFFPDELPHILGEDMAREGIEQLALLDRVDAVLDPDPLTAFGRVATLEASLYMRNQLLRDADWASMAHSVEVRTPLVDAWLLRQLAPVLLRGDGKSVLGSTLPPYLRDRPKTGFFVPMKEWLDLRPDGTTTRMRSWARRVWESFA
ncbi:MAG TPA: asparagine synthase (glutamine-hydrolyzing) [Thermoanaerobaculia bacterium]|nr:asparagine synthase (glutamine-hydrolyzing) [Thermoanaerobaculia bacterium]